MKYYEVDALIQLAGRLHLTDAQAASRRHALKLLDAKAHGENRFETTAEVTFKKGEVLGIEALPKALTGRVTEKKVDFDRLVRTERERNAAARKAALDERARRAEATRRAQADRQAAAAR